MTVIHVASLCTSLTSFGPARRSAHFFSVRTTCFGVGWCVFFRSVTVSVMVECKFEIESLFNYEANNCKNVCLSLLRQ